MEVAVASWVALSLVFVSIIVRWAWSVLDWVWLKPKKLEGCLREQGLQGNSYRIFHGDMKENSVMLTQAKSKPMILSSSHDIASRFIPFLDQTVKTYGTNSFVWIGPTPRVNIMDPEDVKDVFTKLEDFRRPAANPLMKLLITGLASYEDEKWAKHRRIINPTFHVEKLKRMLPAFHQSCNEMIKEWESCVSKQGSSCELDVWPSLQNLTADAISRTAFGSSYLEGRKIFKLLKEQTAHTIKSVQSVYIPGWWFLPTKMNNRMKQIDKELTGLLKGIINKREQAINAGEATKDDLLGALMESNLREIQEHGKNDKDVGMSIEDVIGECKLFYYAGQETTSVLLVWTMVLLGQNQIWQDRARQEVLHAAVLHTAPEVEAEPEPKKLCAPRPPPPDPGCKVDEAKASSGSYYCGFCDKNCDHNTANCPFYDSDAEDDIYGEYKGPKEGFIWICLLGCSGSYCKLDHGKGISRGLYVRRLCDRCHQWDNCTSDCSSKPKFKGAADANVDMGEIENTRT